jgi:hypothetical protein
MKVNRYNGRGESFGEYDLETETIYIDERLHGIDYIETFLHEMVHWYFCKVFGVNRFSNFLNMWFDMFDCFFQTWGNFKEVREIREYYTK